MSMSAVELLKAIGYKNTDEVGIQKWVKKVDSGELVSKIFCTDELIVIEIFKQTLSLTNGSTYLLRADWSIGADDSVKMVQASQAGVTVMGVMSEGEIISYFQRHLFSSLTQPSFFGAGPRKISDKEGVVIDAGIKSLALK